MYETLTGQTRLKAGVVPSHFTWTKDSKERPQNKLQKLKNIAEQQAQEERRQFFCRFTPSGYRDGRGGD